MYALLIPEWLAEPRFWILALGAAAIVAGLYALTVLGHRRQLRQLSEKWGLAFDPKATDVRRFGGVLCAELREQMRESLFGFRNLLSGRVEGIETAYVEYSQRPMLKQRLQRDAPEWERWCVVWMRFPGQNFPNFTLYERKKIFITHGVRGESLWLELWDNPNFGTYFLLGVPHDYQKDRVRQLFTREVQDFFVGERERTWQVRAAGEWMGCYREAVGFGYAEAVFEQARLLRELLARAAR